IIGLKMNPDQSMDMGDNLFQIFVNLYEKAPENFFDKNINPIFSLEYDGTNMIRHKMAQQIAKEIQEDILEDMRNLTINGQKVFEEFNVYVQQTGMVGNDIEIGFSAQTEDKMRKILQRVDSRLKEIDGVKEIGNNANEGERELKLRVNEYGQSLGLSEGYITNALRGSFFKAEYGKMFNQDGLVRIKIEDENKDKKGSVDNFMLTIPTGEVVVLHQVCDFFYQKTFVKTFKEDGLNVRSIYASVDKDTILATEVMQRLQPLLNEIEKEGVTVIVKGEEKENKKLKAEMQQAALIATFLIFIALVWMFNSIIQPLIVLAIIPLSVLGVLVGTKLMGLNMTMTGLMGIIGLAGVVVNDGLIMLSFVIKGKTH
ncbi:MAG TPA: efflux RND transporter permease subunit, partial [Sulfurovum sp.]|nr:efflux RND transporter permease subunit [Sulfurovum sp.]